MASDFQLFLQKMSDSADKVAIVHLGKSYSYLELGSKVRQLSTQLAKQIEQPEVVVIQSDYSFESIALFFALQSLKCVVVPVVTSVDAELQDRIEVSNADSIISIQNGEIDYLKTDNRSEHHPMVGQLFAKQHAGLILFSSGSTGKPKAMVHDLDNLLQSYLDKKTKNISIIVFLMFDHIGGINTLLNSLSMSAKIVIPSNRKPDHIAQLIETYKVNILPSSPTFLNLMLIANVHQQFNLKSLRMITYGTEAMPASLLTKLKTVFSRCKFLQTFGTSETGIIQTSSKQSGSLDIKLDDPEQEYKIVDNELWLRSKTQVLGYLNASMDAFTDDGWFKTGDIVEQKDDGYIRIVGRSKEVINVGGEKVLPSEVESLLLEMPEIKDVLVKGVPNAITGQTVFAQVVVSDGVDTKKMKKSVKEYCKSRIDRFKVPTKIEVTMQTNYTERFKKIRM